MAPDELASAPHSVLSGEAQLAAQQLLVQNLLVYDDLKRAILQRVGRNPEQHRQRFRSLELGENGRPFVMAHQLRDACRRWLLARGRRRRPDHRPCGAGTIHCAVAQKDRAVGPVPPPDLAIQLAEDQMAACHGVGETLPSVSLSPFFFFFSPVFSP